jgi:hypothetical protein
VAESNSLFVEVFEEFNLHADAETKNRRRYSYRLTEPKAPENHRSNDGASSSIGLQTAAGWR